MGQHAPVRVKGPHGDFDASPAHYEANLKGRDGFSLVEDKPKQAAKTGKAGGEG